MVQIKKILCSIDFSADSERAVIYATQLALTLDARLTLLHIVGPFVASSYELSMNVGKVLEAESRVASRNLDRFAKQAERAKVPVHRIVRIGEVEDLIESTVRSEGADLVVVGSERRLFGERVLRSAPCPVLMIPPGSTAKRKKRPQLRAA